MRVRLARVEDVPDVLPMVRAICDLHEERDPARYAFLPDVIRRYARWLPERAVDDRSVFLVAERPDRSLAAFLVATIEEGIPIFITQEYGWIHDVWVEPDARRTGLAGAMVQEALARFRAMGLSQVRLETGMFNNVARHVFEREGFRPCTVEMACELDTIRTRDPMIQ